MAIRKEVLIAGGAGALALAGLGWWFFGRKAQPRTFQLPALTPALPPPVRLPQPTVRQAPVANRQTPAQNALQKAVAIGGAALNVAGGVASTINKAVPGENLPTNVGGALTSIFGGSSGGGNSSGSSSPSASHDVPDSGQGTVAYGPPAPSPDDSATADNIDSSSGDSATAGFGFLA